MQASQIDEAARMLFSARTNAVALRELPGTCRPETQAEGYQIQSKLMLLCGSRVAGWKVGATSLASQKLLGTDRPFSGCLLADRVLHAPANLSDHAFRSPLVEAEYAFVLHALGIDSPLDEKALLGSIKSVHLVIEVCETRFAALTDPGVPSLIADNAVASHVVLGPAIRSWERSDLTEREVTLSINGAAKARGNGTAVLQDPIRSLHWVVNDRRTRGEAVPENFIVSTGSCTGMVCAAAEDFVLASFAGLGTVEARL